MSKFDKYSWAAKPAPIDESEIIRTETYDVVIVGANNVARIWNAQRWSEKVATYMTPQKMKSLARKVRL